jgi:hypothetical protein
MLMMAALVAFITIDLELHQVWGMRMILYIQGHRTLVMDGVMGVCSVFGFELLFFIVPSMHFTFIASLVTNRFLSIYLVGAEEIPTRWIESVQLASIYVAADFHCEDDFSRAPSTLVGRKHTPWKRRRVYRVQLSFR